MSATTANLVGEAFTLRYIPAREDLDVVGVFEDPQHPQRRAVETVPPGQVLVMDCRRDARAASGGSILLMRLKVRGVAGIVTDGGLRDSVAIAGMDFPVYGAGGGARLNLAIHHAVDLNVPIGCGGVAVFPGDVIVGDGEVVVVPRHLADEVARDARGAGYPREFVFAKSKRAERCPEHIHRTRHARTLSRMAAEKSRR